MCADHAHGDMQRGNGMVAVSEFEKVALMVVMEGRGLPMGSVSNMEALKACIAEGWVIPSGEWGWVLSGPGMERLAGFRALFARVDDSE